MSEKRAPQGPILTLEPLLEAVREGLEGEGWELSGLQKTTSHEFEGRWAGDSSRSAYLFFHKTGASSRASIDGFLDETTRGLKGNLALVLDGPVLEEISDPGEALDILSRLASRILPGGYRAPLTLRYRLPNLGDNAGQAATEIRFKLLIPRKAMVSGFSAISALAGAAAKAFQGLLEAPELEPFWPEEETSGSVGE